MSAWAAHGRYTVSKLQGSSGAGREEDAACVYEYNRYIGPV